MMTPKKHHQLIETAARIYSPTCEGEASMSLYSLIPYTPDWPEQVIKGRVPAARSLYPGGAGDLSSEGLATNTNGQGSQIGVVNTVLQGSQFSELAKLVPQLLVYH